MNAKPPRRGVPKPAVIRATGGRGRRGPLGVWLLANAARIQVAEADFTLRWDDVGRDAAADGVEVRPGEPYGSKAVSNAWGVLLRAGRVKGLEAQEPSVPARPTPDGTVPSPRGQDGIGGAGGGQPLAPLPPTITAPPGPAERVAGAAPEKPKVTATSMPPRRRFGDT